MSVNSGADQFPIQSSEAGTPVGQGVGGINNKKSIADLQQGIKKKFKENKEDIFDGKYNLLLAKGNYKDLRTDAFLYGVWRHKRSKVSIFF